MKKALDWFVIVVFVVLVFLVVVLSSAADDKRPKHRAITAEEMIQLKQTEAIKFMLQGLKQARFMGQLEEALKCPCYDVKVSTVPEGGTILRLHKDRCTKEEKK